MNLDDVKSTGGRHKRRGRVGRGRAAGQGKTCGYGHNGQRSRSGGHSVVGFEGGQMPLQRRLPKFGFVSRKARFNAEVRVGDLGSLNADSIDLEALKVAKIVGKRVKRAKIIAAGKLDKAVVVKGIAVTPGARAAIEAAGGKVEPS